MCVVVVVFCSLVMLGGGCKVGGFSCWGVVVRWEGSHGGLGRHCYTGCSGWW